MINKPTQHPTIEKGKVYEKLPHTFKVSEEVRLPGSRTRNQHCQNQFLYNKTGVIEKRGWSATPISVKDKKINNPETGGFWWSRKLVHVPIYKVNGKWYTEDKLTGIQKIA